MAQDTSAAIPEVPSGPRREVLIVLPGLLLAIMLAMLDQLVVSTALPRIVGDLGGVTHLSWVVTAYVLASTVTTPLYGKLGDQYGRKRLLMAAIVIFLIGSALSGMAHSMDQLIAFRAVQGLGAGGLLVGCDRDHRRPGLAAGAGPVHGLHDGGDEPGHDRRPAGRRLHHRQPVLAVDLLHQHAGRRGRADLPVPHLAPAPSQGPAQDRLPGGRAARGGRRLGRAADHLGRLPVRLAVGADHGAGRAGGRRDRRLPVHREPGRRAGAAAARVPQPQLLADRGR